MGLKKNQLLNKLFLVWKKNYSESENFVKDGIVNEELFDKARTKILFITKEPNDPKQEGTDFREWWNEGVYYSFSYRIAEWSYGILNDFIPYDNIWIKNDDSRALQAIQSIAFMNVKKSGGIGSSKEKDINKYIERDIEFIHKQIKIIDPEIIIIGMSWASTVDLLFPDLKWIKSGYAINLARFNESKVIDFYHPSARNGVAASYSLLQNVINTVAFKKL